MKAITIKNKGPDSELIIDEIDRPKPGPDELLVKVKATALNRADLMQRAGHYPSPDDSEEVLGLEMSGTIEQTGSNVTTWNEGDRVFGLLAAGGYAEYVCIDRRMAMPIPSNMSFEEAAAVPETFLTAYQALCWLGELNTGDHVLIHAGGSGVGTAAIQISSLHDCTIVTTAGTDHKLEKAESLGADLSINYKNQDFAEVIAQEMGASPIDLIIDFIGRPYWHSNIKVLNQDGYLIYLAFLGGKKVNGVDLSKILFKRLTIRGSTLRNRPLSYKIDLTQDFRSFALKHFKEERLQPVIDSVFDWTEVEKAHLRMHQNLNTGKIILNGM